MEELLKQLQERKERAYRTYRELELTGGEIDLAYTGGLLDGMQIIIDIVKEYIKEDTKDGK